MKNQRKAFRGREDNTRCAEMEKNKVFWKMASTIVHFGWSVARICTERLAQTRVFEFPVTALEAVLVQVSTLRRETAVPKFKNKTNQLQSSCHILISSSMSQVQILEIWSPLYGSTDSHLLQLVQNIVMRPFQPPILDISCSVTEFQALSSSCFFPTPFC